LAPKEALDLARKMASDLKTELEPPRYDWNEVQ